MSATLDLKKIEQDWKARGFSFGKVELEMKGTKGCPPVGKEVLIPARERHSVRNLNHSGPARWLYGYAKRWE